jgi:hypothetical protein
VRSVLAHPHRFGILLFETVRLVNYHGFRTPPQRIKLGLFMINGRFLVENCPIKTFFKETALIWRIPVWMRGAGKVPSRV